jgi:hypothetical protein
MPSSVSVAGLHVDMRRSDAGLWRKTLSAYSSSSTTYYICDYGVKLTICVGLTRRLSRVEYLRKCHYINE